MCDMTHSYVSDKYVTICYNLYVWCDSFTCVTWLIHMWVINMWQYAIICMCDMTHSHVWHAIHRICVIYEWQYAHKYVWYGAFICVIWLIHMCDTPFIEYAWYTSDNMLIYMCDMAHSYVWCDSFTCVTCHSSDMRDIDETIRSFVYVRHAPFICVMCRYIYTCTAHPNAKHEGNTFDIAHLYVWHVPYICVTRPIHVWDMARSYV